MTAVDEAAAQSGSPSSSAAEAVTELERRLGKGILYPISYAVPRSLFVDGVPVKTRLLAEPAGRISTDSSAANAGYRFGPGEQEDYYGVYRDSVFARTGRKGGWDCLRHLEILMNGCIPQFESLESCPRYTMTHYPKNFLRKLRDRYEPVLAEGAAMALHPDDQACRAEAARLLAFTREHLNTEALARYFLDAMGAAGAQSVLFLSRLKKPDYQCEMLLHGLRTVLGRGLVDAEKRWWLYDSASPQDVGRLYGNGFTYTRHLADIPIDRERIPQRIRAREFDLVVYGNIERGTPFLPLVRNHYERDRVALVDGGDYDLFPGQEGRAATRRPWRDRVGAADRGLAGAGVIFKREISERTVRAFASRRSGAP